MAKRKIPGGRRGRPGTAQIERQPRGQNLESMSVDALLALRDELGTALSQKITELRSQLGRLGDREATSSRRQGARGRSGKGGKLPPKYRDPDKPSNVWAGRGALPRWMTEKIKAGAKREDFVIGAKSASRKKQSAKKTAKRSSAKASRARKQRQSAPEAPSSSANNGSTTA